MELWNLKAKLLKRRVRKIMCLFFPTKEVNYWLHLSWKQRSELEQNFPRLISSFLILLISHLGQSFKH